MFKFNNITARGWESFVCPKQAETLSWNKTKEIMWWPAGCCGAIFETQEETHEVSWAGCSTHTKGIRILPGRTDCFVSDLEEKKEISIGGNILTLVVQKRRQKDNISIPTKKHTFTDDDFDVEVTIPYYASLQEAPWRITDTDVAMKWDSIQSNIKLYKERGYRIPRHYKDCTVKALKEWQQYSIDLFKIATEAAVQLYIYTNDQAESFNTFRETCLSHMDLLWKDGGIHNNNYDRGGRLNIAIFGAK